MNASLNFVRGLVAGKAIQVRNACGSASAPRLLGFAGLLFTLSLCASAAAITINPGDLIIGDAAVGSNRLIRVDFAGNTAEVITSGGLLMRPSGVAVNHDTGAIYTVNQLGSTAGTGKIIQVTTPGGIATQTTVADGHGANGDFNTPPSGVLRHPRDLKFQADGQLVVAERNINFDGVNGANGIVRVNLSVDQFLNQSVVKTGSPFLDPAALAVAPNGHIFLGDLAGAAGSTNALYHVSPNGLTVTSLDGLISGGLHSVLAVQVATSDSLGRATQLFLADRGNSGGTDGQIFRVDLTYSGATNTIFSAIPTLISTGTVSNAMGDPTAMTIDQDGTLYVVDGTQKGVYRILNPLGSPTTSYLNLLTAGGGVNFTFFSANGLDVFYLNPQPEVVPIPEPNSGLLLVLGSLGMIRFGGRRRRVACCA